MASVAIVGAGPSGCFTAQALSKARPDLQIDILDRLPVPYGLVRYGVAPDHQGTKAVIRQFERLFERQGVGFFGNVRLGTDISLDELLACYDAVVLALGLSGDRRLGIPGEDLDGVFGSGVVTRAWNDHPDADGWQPIIGKDVVIMGNGNVAVDLVRILAKGEAEFEGSDLSPDHIRALASAGPRTITVVGRSPAELARFDPVMLRELGRLEQARIAVGDLAGEGKIVEALAAIDGHGAADAPNTITFRFGWTPTSLSGEGHVAQAHFRASDGSDQDLSLPCDTFLTAIGFAPADPGEPPLPAADDGAIAPRLYATGWYRRGPRGTIPENRADAQAVAARILADLDAGDQGNRPGRSALAARLPQAVGYEGWLAIDRQERDTAPEGRVRRKIANRDRMLAIARNEGDNT